MDARFDASDFGLPGALVDGEGGAMQDQRVLSAERFEERQCLRGHLGTFPARDLLGLLLAHAGRLEKYGA